MATKHILSLTVGAVLSGLVLLGADRPASADIIPTLVSVTGDAATGFIWTYDADVTVDQRVEAGDYFTIYDFEGYIPGSGETHPAGWTFSAQNLGQTPSDIAVTDNPGLVNLTWTWTGSPIPGSANLGLFSAKSTISHEDPGHFTGYATRNFEPASGTKISNVGQVGVPGLPEPGSLALLATAFVAATAHLARRRA